MVTKVRNLSQSFEYESNLEQDILNTTGLTFAHFAGEVFLGNALVDIAAGTVTVPVGAFVIWLDVTTVTVPAMKATNVVGVAAIDSIILYTGTSTVTDIDQSTVVDHRSFTTGRRGPSATVSDVVQTQDPEAAPGNPYWVMRSRMATWDDVHKDWNTGAGENSNERQTANLVMDDASGVPIRAIGVANILYTINGTPTFGEVGPTFLKGQAIGAMGFDGSTDFIRPPTNNFSADAVGVYWGWFFAGSSGSGNGRIILAQSNAAGTVSGEWGVSGANEVFFQMFTTGGSYRLEVDTPNIVHNTWNFVVIVQRGGNSGAQIYWNGTLYNKDTGNTTETITGAATRDWWWSNIWSALGRQGSYASRADTGASFKFEGRLFDIGLAVPVASDFPLQWPDANVDKLMRSAGF